jgi:hypothetical protein
MALANRKAPLWLDASNMLIARFHGLLESIVYLRLLSIQDKPPTVIRRPLVEPPRAVPALDAQPEDKPSKVKVGCLAVDAVGSRA